MWPSNTTAARNLAAFTGCSLDAAVGAASTTASAVLGVQPDAGDLVLLDADHRVAATLVQGSVVFDRDGRLS